MSAAEHQPTAAEPPARLDAFISYAREDREFVELLCSRLVARELDVWVDLEDIPPAADWRSRVDAGISAAAALVFVVSPDSVASPVCREELARGVALNKRLIPIVHRDVDADALPPALERRNWILFRCETDADHALAEVVEALQTDLEWREAQARLTVRASEWLGADRDRSYLLRGSDLASAERWLAQQSAHRERATQEQTDYVLASRQAAARRQRTTLGAAAVALVVAIRLSVFALVQRSQAITREHVARSRELAGAALGRLEDDPELAVLLAREGERVRGTDAAEHALRQTLAAVRWRWLAPVSHGSVGGLALSGDGLRVAAMSDPGASVPARKTTVLDIASGGRIAILRGGLVAGALDRAGNRLATVDAPGHVHLRPLATPDRDRDLGVVPGSGDLPATGFEAAGVVFSPDGRRLFAINYDIEAKGGFRVSKRSTTVAGEGASSASSSIRKAGARGSGTRAQGGSSRISAATSKPLRSIRGDGASPSSPAVARRSFATPGRARPSARWATPRRTSGARASARTAGCCSPPGNRASSISGMRRPERRSGDSAPRAAMGSTRSTSADRGSS